MVNIISENEMNNILMENKFISHHEIDNFNNPIKEKYKQKIIDN